MTPPIDAHQIAPRLYQGANPPQGPELRARGFDVLVLCAVEWQYDARNYPGLQIIRAPMLDTAEVPSRTAHRAAERVAREWRAGKRILIACNMGWNRSGLVSALTLWRLTGRPGAECMWRVQQQRPRALSNESFALYLYHLPPYPVRRPGRVALLAVRHSVGA